MRLPPPPAAFFQARARRQHRRAGERSAGADRRPDVGHRRRAVAGGPDGVHHFQLGLGEFALRLHDAPTLLMTTFVVIKTTPVVMPVKCSLGSMAVSFLYT